MEAKVPQRIDMEDQVIGPLTLVQFFYLLFGGLIIYILNSWLVGSFRIFFYFLAPILAALSLAFAFLKIQDRPFSVFFFSLISFVSRPRQRVWTKGEHVKLAKVVVKEEKKVETPHKSFDIARVNDLSRIVDAEDPRQ